jgi:hypothetical protein
MPLPEEVHRRLAARAVTDLDVASLLEQFTKSDETVSEPSARSSDRGCKRPSSEGSQFNLTYYTFRSSDQRG